MSSRTAVLDACVLYSAPLRDLLIRLAIAGLFDAKWSAAIHDEWMRNLTLKRPDLTPQQVSRTRELMDRAVPDAVVAGYEGRLDGLLLPDPDDRHVLAAAIHVEAKFIVTSNMGDFPETELRKDHVEAIGPDEFLSLLLGRRRTRCALR